MGSFTPSLTLQRYRLFLEKASFLALFVRWKSFVDCQTNRAAYAETLWDLFKNPLRIENALLEPILLISWLSSLVMIHREDPILFKCFEILLLQYNYCWVGVNTNYMLQGLPYRRSVSKFSVD